MPTSQDAIFRDISSADSQLTDWGVRSDLSEIERYQNRFGSAIWVLYLFAATAIASYFGAESSEDWICALVVEIAAFYPVFIWAKKKVLGIPIMPAYAMLFLVYYALPFASGHPVVHHFDFADKWFAAATVAGVLLIMTLIWSLLAKPQPPRVRVIKALSHKADAVPILIACLAAAVVFQSNLIFDVISSVSSEIYGVMRAILLTLGLLSIICLAFLHGTGTLRTVPKYLYMALTAVFIMYNAASLYLITATQYGTAAIFGYFLGSGRMPWKLMVAILTLLIVFQMGKEDIRLKYSESGPTTSTVNLVQEWFNTGLENLLGSSRPDSLKDPVPLFQRLSLVHMVLLTQTEAPAIVPYLYGSSYTGIPLLMVPRIIWPERPNTSELLVQLNEHYGLLTRESAQTVSIGWGLIAEANANYGFIGCISVAIVLGVFLGMTQRWCGRFSFLSARGMVALVITFGMLGMEASMAQLITTAAQSLVAVLLLALTVMQPQRVIV